MFVRTFAKLLRTHMRTMGVLKIQAPGLEENGSKTSVHSDYTDESLLTLERVEAKSWIRTNNIEKKLAHL